MVSAHKYPNMLGVNTLYSWEGQDRRVQYRQVQYCVLAIWRSDNFLGLPEPSFRLGMVRGGRFLAFLASLLTVLRSSPTLMTTWVIPPCSHANNFLFPTFCFLFPVGYRHVGGYQNLSRVLPTFAVRICNFGNSNLCSNWSQQRMQQDINKPNTS